MIFDLPFDVVFCTDYQNETVTDGWQEETTRGYKHYFTEKDGLRYQILVSKEKNWYLKVINISSEPITGFVGIRFSWKNNDEDYTLVPGIYYNGNEQSLLNPIPKINRENPVFEASFSAASFPTVLMKQGKIGYHYDISPMSSAGWNGVAFDSKNASFTVYAPAKEEKIYRHQGFNGTRLPYTWNCGDIISIRFSRNEFECNTVCDLFDYHWQKAIRSDFYPAHNTPKIEENEGAKLVRDWVYEKHSVITPKGEPMILNAFTNVEGYWPYGGAAEWNIMIGWCDGTMTALPMLKFGGKYHDFAVKFIDFLSTHGNSPSGVKYCVYDGEAWMTKDHKEYSNAYTHCRFYSDYLTYLGKAIRFEKENGYSHPDWEKDFELGMNVLTGLWKREKDFGIYWDLESKDLKTTRKMTGAGSFCVLSLSEGTKIFPENEEIRKCFEEACDVYYERCVITGRCNGGPVDIKEADDSESIGALTNALLERYKLFGGEDNLKKATDAAKLFATWVVNYVPPFPCGSMLENVNVCGGVLANVQNRHVGPGICTNSARFLYDLGKETGDSRWTDLYFRVKAAAINCITRYDGEFFGSTFDSPFLKGMLSEQINVSDALNRPGETWRVSACWPATAVLLGWFETAEE